MTTVRIAKAALLLGAAWVAGCAKADKADCEKMVDRMTEIELEGQPPLVQEMTKKMMGETKTEIVGECEGKIAKSQVQCVIDAKTKADIDKCK